MSVTIKKAVRESTKSVWRVMHDKKQSMMEKICQTESSFEIELSPSPVWKFGTDCWSLSGPQTLL